MTGLRALLWLSLLSGCISQPNELPDPGEQDAGVDSGPPAADMTAASDASDVSVSRDVGVDSGSPDLGADMTPATLTASSVADRLDALWLFEPGAVDQDSVGDHGLETNEGTPSTAAAFQGDGGVVFATGQVATVAPNDSIGIAEPGFLMVGGWFREAAEPDSVSMLSAYQAGVGGWALAIDAGSSSPTCLVHDGIDGDQFESSNYPVTRTAWNHYACAFEIDAMSNVTTTLFINGEVAAQDSLHIGSTVSGPFTIGSVGTSEWVFAGEVDEVFVTHRSLEPRLLRKLAACGVNGDDCICDPAVPTQYLDCGRIGNCGRLPDCR